MGKVLVACEFSGIVRDAFIARGHDAMSCDFRETERPGPHYRGDVRDLLYSRWWDLMIAHPDCTFLCSSGLHWNARRPGRAAKTAEALAFVRLLMGAPIEKQAIENPPGRIGTAIRKADQIIQPNQFGHDASKQTALWLRNLPKLIPTVSVPPRLVCCGEVVAPGASCPRCGGSRRPLPRWANQTNSGQNRLPPSETRAADRARTYQGIADAMAEQWGALLEAS